MTMTAALAVGATSVFAALTYVFYIRPAFDEREARREMAVPNRAGRR